MSDFLVCIVDKGHGEKAGAFLASNGEKNILLSLGKGTAPSRLLNIFSLGETEKEIIWCSATRNNAAELIQELERHFFRKGEIAFSIMPNTAFKNNMGDNYKMTDYCLIIAITDKGYTEDVMEAARAVGAKGGTALNARGVGLPDAEKFFGVTLQADKEMIMIIANNKDAQNIADAASKVRGKSGTVVFRLPVSAVAGFNNI